jgi:PAS domain S-box-containing protein
MFQQDHSSELVSFLLSLVKNAPYGIITVNTGGHITMANTLASKHIGFPIEEALDKHIVDYIMHIPELKEKLEICLRTGRKSFEIAQCGSNAKCLTVKANVINDGILITTEDITKKVESEEEMKRLNSVLLANNKQLEQYAYIVSHNLRAPVANIMGLSDILTSGAADESVRETVMENIHTSAHNLSEILSDLNEIIATKTKLSEIKQALNFEQELQRVKETLAQQISESGATIISDFKNAPEVFTVKSYLNSILHNLMSNAIKYRNPDKQLKINIKTNTTSNTVELTFGDNGLGIDLQKNGDKIFGLYKRFHHEIEGKGIGLHLVKTQIEALGGDISVASTPNAGTEFTITLLQ